MNKKKSIAIILLIVVIALFFIVDIGQYFNLSSIKKHQDAITNYYSVNPIQTLLIYCGSYVLLTSLSLPAAGIMTLLGGAIFGTLLGTLLVSISATIGATIAFLITRYLFRDYVQRRFEKQLYTINKGIKNEGGFYLFTMRMTPVFPFFMINAVMALTPIKTAHYSGITLIGMLPVTLIYVNAGSQLAQITSLDDILSPSLIISFTLLGLAPLITKRIVKLLRQKRT